MSKNKSGKREQRKVKRNLILGDSNVFEDTFPNSSSDEEVANRKKLLQRRKSFIDQDKGRRAADESRMETPRTEKRKSTGGASGTEFSSDGDRGSDSENQRVGKTKRVRRRLSKKGEEARTSLNMSYGNLNNSTIASPTTLSPKNPTDKKTLQEIYSTCSALFQAHKITPQNAFSLKLVECLDEIIQSDDFDRRNLPLLARTLEIGGKIYVCRVDCTHAHTIKLATEIAANQNEEHPNDDGGEEVGQDIQDIQEEAEGRKKTRAKAKKRSRFQEDNEAKLNTRFEDQSSKYASRRTSLKAKLHRNIDEELDFDYLSYFHKPGETHPFETEEEYVAKNSNGQVPDSHVNEDEIKQVPWLPFNALSEWDPSKADIWGVPLASTDPMDMSSLQRQTPCLANDDDFAYNPENRPEEYPAAEGADNDVRFPHDNDGFGDDHFDDGPGSGNRNALDISKPIALDNLKSLDDLRRFFQSLKGNQVDSKNKYGWAGPVFLKPQRFDINMKRKATDGKREKKPRKQKTLILKYDEVDWKDPANKYIDGGLSKTTLDDKTLNKWFSTRTLTPYCGSSNFLGYDEEEEDYRNPFDAVEGNDNPIANIASFFIDPNRNIFKLMEQEFKAGKDLMSQSVLGARDKQDDDFGGDMDIEAPRDFADDSLGDMLVHPEGEPQMEGGADDLLAAGMNLTAMFPGTLGFDTNDPFSRASEFDSIKFSKQPKPIDMHALKVVIRKILKEKLQTDEDGKPTKDEETKYDLMSLVTEMFKAVDSRMAKHMSMAIIVVGLMHVVADNKYFMIPDACAGISNPYVVCRGRKWKHKEHIPMSSHCDEN